MEIEQIYKNVDNIILTHLMINDDAMKITQSLGYNGFKRLHRYETKYLLCKHQELENSYFDKYQKVLNANVSNPIYNPISLKDHLEKWRDLLTRHIQELGELNQEHFDVIGITNCIIEDTICCFMKKLEKVNRWIMRFNESDWNSVEIHYVDDCLHKKMKKKEEEGE
jgi:hypothetical protein